MIRSKGEAGTGNVVEAVRHLRSIIGDIKKITQADEAELFGWAKRAAGAAAARAGDRRDRQAARPAVLRRRARHAGRRRARRCSSEPKRCSSVRASSSPRIPSPRAKAIVEATTHFQDAAHPRQGEPRARRADDRHRDGRHQPAVRRSGLVNRSTAESPRRTDPGQVGVLGVLACRARSPPTSSDSRSLGVDAPLVRDARRSRTASTRSPCPAARARRCRSCSTTSELFDPLSKRIDDGMPVFGTCAGMILCATEVLDGRPDQRGFERIDITVRRNGYGRQLDSFEADVDVEPARRSVPRRVHPGAARRPRRRRGRGARRARRRACSAA